MQILIPDSWLREFIETDASPKQIQEALSLCGPSIERLHKKGSDFVYDIEVTTNRVDMMSVRGIARECAAILPRFGYKAKVKTQNAKVQLETAKKVDYLTVKIDPKLCPRFSAVLVEDVKVGESPKVIKERLGLAGLRALNNVVDISNYLMLEMGQPVHTFDYDKITSHFMTLRESKKGEQITTLDNQTFSLPGDDIVIEDGGGQLIDLCGIMGGLNSAVDEQTKNVLLFVQVYDSTHIRKTSMALAHRTDAAVLFEKNLPVENVLPTLERGGDLFTQLTGGQAKKIALDLLSAKEGDGVIKLRQPLSRFIGSRLGIDLPLTEIKTILLSLEFNVKSEFEVDVPWVRKLDVAIAEDLVEEVARIYGYHNLPSQLMAGSLPTNRSDDKSFYWESKIKNALKSWGFTETYTYSLVAEDSELKLKNPLSLEWKYLRTNLTNSHQKVIFENLGREKELHFFEVANVYIPRKNDLPQERLHLIVSAFNIDYSKFKGVIEALFNLMNVSSDIKIQKDGKCLYFEGDLTKLIDKASSTKTYVPISKYAPIIEDVNLALNTDYDTLIKKIKKVSPLINQIELIDKFGDKLTLRTTYHSDDKQLSNKDIVDIRNKIMSLS